MERPDELKPDEEVAQLKAEISGNQAELQNTVAEIQDRLSPAHLKDQAAASVREATIGRMQHMMNSTSSMPYAPWALIGIGAAWLFASQRSSSQWRGNGGSWSGDREYGTNYSTGYRSSDDPYRPAGQTGSTTAEWQAAASDRAAAVSDSARHAARQARYRWGSLINNNPMALGIAALAAGALVGSVLPATETENEYLGDVRDNAVESAKSMVNETVQKATGSEEPL
jgi:ElaB/YqjD/DUF883 family membrane-anchored ribosome-binding protein